MSIPAQALGETVDKGSNLAGLSGRLRVMTYKLVLLRHGQSAWNKTNQFTGWVDVPLTEQGEAEAKRGGELLKEKNVLPDIVFTSLLRRAINTANIALDAADRLWIPVQRDWRLNERHYGALQGKNKTEIRQEYGDEKFMLWRRSYATPPPEIDPNDQYAQNHDPRYAGDPVPEAECLANVVERVKPYFESAIDNFGVEFGLWKGRMKGEFNVYTKKTSNLLSNMDLPHSNGFASYVDNVGEVKNNGWEASASVYVIRNAERDINWIIGGQLTYNKNYVSKLSEAIKAQNEAYLKEDVDVANLFYEGRPQNGIYVVRSLGIDPANGQEIFLDKDGNRKNLSDWLGNYVYIDVWATWCGPCCRELPAFHKLKEEFKDKPICFVSISIDADEAAWRAKIEKDSLDGIQLRVNEEDTFKKDYKISWIPRFLLIDREGKVLDANMTRPSDTKTIEKLTALLSDR